MKISRNDKYTFTKHWFNHHIENWQKLFGPLRKKKIYVLEIGSFEGASTTWILDELFGHPESRLIAIDTFTGSIEHSNANYELSDLEERFRNNVKQTGKADQLTVMKDISFNGLIKLNIQKEGPFDLIYIDGSHLARDVLSDAVLAWPLLKKDGYMVFDDYAWDLYKENYNNPRLAIDSFLASNAQDTKVIYKSYQLIVQKTKRNEILTLANPARKE